MKPKASELVAGAFVLIMLIVFLGFLSEIGGGLEAYWAPKQIVVTWFSDIGGLKKNVPVTYQGVIIGDVTNIEFDSDRKIRVTMLIQDKFIKEHFTPRPEGVIATIMSASLLGDPYIELTTQYTPAMLQTMTVVCGDTKTNATENGIIRINGLDPTSFGMIMAKGTQFLNGAQKHMDELSDTLGRILTGAEIIVGDSATQNNIRVSMANIRAATDKFPGTMNQAQAFLTSANGATTRVNHLLQRSEDTIASILNNTDELMVNARVVSYGLASKPSMLVWGDKTWEARVARRDPDILSASLRSSVPTTTPQTGSTPVAAAALSPKEHIRPPNSYR